MSSKNASPSSGGGGRDRLRVPLHCAGGRRHAGPAADTIVLARDHVRAPPESGPGTAASALRAPLCEESATNAAMYSARADTVAPARCCRVASRSSPTAHARVQRSLSSPERTHSSSARCAAPAHRPYGPRAADQRRTTARRARNGHRHPLAESWRRAFPAAPQSPAGLLRPGIDGQSEQVSVACSHERRLARLLGPRRSLDLIRAPVLLRALELLSAQPQPGQHLGLPLAGRLRAHRLLALQCGRPRVAARRDRGGGLVARRTGA